MTGSAKQVAFLTMPPTSISTADADRLPSPEHRYEVHPIPELIKSRILVCGSSSWSDGDHNQERFSQISRFVESLVRSTIDEPPEIGRAVTQRFWDLF